MRYLKEYNSWNPVLNKEVLDFIETNKTRLLHLWDKEKSEEENMEFLTNYFTEYPELMKSDINISNIKIPKTDKGIRRYAPVLQNIGGVKDFRSF